MNLIQLINRENERSLALVSGNSLQLVANFNTAYDLIQEVLNKNISISDLLHINISDEILNYEEIWLGKGQWKILPAFDHPTDVNKCMVSGTGLTHKASALNRDKMNDAAKKESETDSMKMYFMGEKEGKPGVGNIGVQPEWFYKGNGSVLRAHNDYLDVPDYALDGGEEPEIAGIYVIDKSGNPVRVGFATGNEFSDHVMEKMNYLYLAPSKIRTCSIGPELVLDETFQNLKGKVGIIENGKTIWEKEVKTGEENMAHSLENLEYHHFKYENHRQPGQVHIHFFGTGAFSFGDGIKIKSGNQMKVEWEGMGKALINPSRITNSSPQMIEVKSLTI